MKGASFDTSPPDPNEYKELVEQLRASTAELIELCCSIAAIKQHAHATDQKQTDLDEETLGAICRASDEFAATINAPTYLAEVRFEDIMCQAAERELSRMVAEGIIPRRNSRKYRLDASAFRDYSDIEQADELTAPYVNMLQGVGVNSVRAASGKQMQRTNKGTAVLQQHPLTITFDSYDQLKGGLSTGAKKLLDMGSIKLARENHYRDTQHMVTTVTIPLEEYCTLRGFDIVRRPTMTPEEEAAEKKRLDGVMCNARKKANSELSTLFAMSLSWSEVGGTGKSKARRDYADVRVLQGKGIKNGHIHMQFTEALTSYLVQAYIMPYPKALLAIDERNERAYNIGFKLALHHGMSHNEEVKTNHLISVKALLDACGDVPTHEELERSTNQGHWRRFIQDPLERCLDDLVRRNVLTRWEYANARGAALTDDQLRSRNYAEFECLFVSFDMPDSRL